MYYANICLLVKKKMRILQSYMPSLYFMDDTFTPASIHALVFNNHHISGSEHSYVYKIILILMRKQLVYAMHMILVSSHCYEDIHSPT